MKIIYGEKKVQIIEHIVKNCDDNLLFKGTYKEIMEDVGVSKPTVVTLFATLRKYHLLYKEKNGLYRLNKKIISKENRMKIIDTPNAPKAIGPYSQAIGVGEFIFTSGQIPLLPSGELLQGDIKEQTTQALENLQAVLEEGGSDFAHVVKTTIFLASMSDFNDVNDVYGKFFHKHKPARSTVAVKTLPKDVLVEIEAIALRK